ncbi:hypothetical protein [Acidocella aromatica]|uniref:Roadblock/LAMTOR2 domain-containing protein n=1 Tax=Acidocella aromatica TaxID=1303579 RepID=A0A840VR57_9PROT|nr:hypothetical protein [Acidocella aromatica]MBB5372772.1 hypothetical protein [Acidocella aromatica]
MSTLESSLTTLAGLKGALSAAVVDYNSGMVLGSKGNGIDIEVASAGNTELIRAKLRTMKDLGITGTVEDILVTLDQQYHILRPSQSSPGLFIYFILDKETGNLALARRKVQDVDRDLVV